MHMCSAVAHPMQIWIRYFYFLVIIKILMCCCNALHLTWCWLCSAILLLIDFFCTNTLTFLFITETTPKLLEKREITPNSPLKNNYYSKLCHKSQRIYFIQSIKSLHNCMRMMCVYIAILSSSCLTFLKSFTTHTIFYRPKLHDALPHCLLL